MNSFFAGITFTFSTLALIASGFSVYQVSKFQNSLESQANNIEALSQRDLANKDTPVIPTASNSNIIQDKQVNETPSQEADSAKKSSAIQPDQFVNKGFDNKLKVEIESTKRIQNPDTGDQDIVVVNFRILSLVPKMESTFLYWKRVKGRNPDTSEEYSTEKYSDTTYLHKLPNNAWANAYIWLQVSEGVKVIDIAVPETAMFRNVPIGS